MVDHVERLGGEVRTSAPVKEFVLNDDGSIKHLLLRSGEIVEADEYISAVPVDIFKRLTPRAWSTMPLPAVRRARGHPGDEHPALVRPEALVRRRALLQPLAA